ncbi:MAG: hypothetical protein NC908_00125, partial [Candidatus Omnitrophica bacterium]|nr:hypothetical protein [Candidatus Omnitrophota bacterium]
KDYEHCLTPGQTLLGNDPIPMHEVGRLAKTIAEDIDESIVRLKNKEGTLGKLLYDDSIYRELEIMARQIQGLIKEVEELIKDIRQHPWKLFWKTREKPQKR